MVRARRERSSRLDLVNRGVQMSEEQVCGFEVGACAGGALKPES